MSDGEELVPTSEQSLRAAGIAALREEVHRPDPRVRWLGTLIHLGCVPATMLLIVGAPVCWTIGVVWGIARGPTHFSILLARLGVGIPAALIVSAPILMATVLAFRRTRQWRSLRAKLALLTPEERVAVLMPPSGAAEADRRRWAEDTLRWLDVRESALTPVEPPVANGNEPAPTEDPS
jgi:hypothetical protein